MDGHRDPLIRRRQLLIPNPQIPRALKTERFICNLVTNFPWTDEGLFLVFRLLGVNIHSFGCRNINVFDYWVLPQIPLGVLNNICAELPF